jgi:Ca2+-binding RTX toxin-like protein
MCALRLDEAVDRLKGEQMTLRLTLRPVSALVVTCLVFTGMIAAGSVAVAAKPKCLDEKATIVAKKGQNVVKGTKKADVIAGTNGGQTIKGKGGADLICGFGGKDRILGQGGPDTIDGGGGNDNLNGGKGAQDIVAGNTGNDTVNGGPGNIDFLLGLEGNDDINGGGGDFDTVDYSFSEAAVTVNLTSGTATGEGNDTLTAVGDVFGSEFDDSLTGNDIPEGNGFYGLAGNDSIDGGTGPLDILFHPGAAGPLTIDLTAGTASGEGTDTLIDIEDAEGSPGDDVMTGSAAANLLVGGEGNDQIFGLAGDDLLEGDGDPGAPSGTDTIDGGDGNDTCLNGETLTSCESTTPPSSRGQAAPGRPRDYLRR